MSPPSVPLYSLLSASGWGGIRTHGSVSRHRRFQVYAVMTTSAPNQRGFLPSAKYIATEWLPFYPWCRHCAYFNALRCEPVIVVCFLLVEFVPLTMGDQPVVNYTWTTSVLTNQVSGMWRIWTSAPIARPSSLANYPLQPNLSNTPNSGLSWLRSKSWGFSVLRFY